MCTRINRCMVFFPSAVHGFVVSLEHRTPTHHINKHMHVRNDNLLVSILFECFKVYDDLIKRFSENDRMRFENRFARLFSKLIISNVLLLLLFHAIQQCEMKPLNTDLTVD